VAYANELAYLRCIDDFKWLGRVNYKLVWYWSKAEAYNHVCDSGIW